MGNEDDEFALYGDYMADACVFLMKLPDEQFQPLLAANRNDGLPPVVNIGSGEEVRIAELARLVKEAVGFEREIVFDAGKPDGTMRKLLDVERLSKLGWIAAIAMGKELVLAYQDFKNREDDKCKSSS
jgi:GDP-L-fucose synthase